MKVFFGNFFNLKKISLIRARVIVYIFLAMFAAEFALFSNFTGLVSYNSFLANIVSGVLVDMANTERSFSSLKKLETSPLLENAARLKAKDMAEKGYFAHTSPAGVTPWYWFQRVGYKFTYAGENLGVNFTDSSVLHQAWLNSASHRKNIISGRFTQIGIGTAEGTYKGKNAVFVVQLFGALKDAVAKDGQSSTPQSDHNKIVNEKPAVVSTDVLGEAIQTEVIEESDLFVAAKDVALVEEGIPPVENDFEMRYSVFLAKTLTTPKILNALFVIFASIAFLLAVLSARAKKILNIYSLALNSAIVFIAIVGALVTNHWIFSTFQLIS